MAGFGISKNESEELLANAAVEHGITDPAQVSYILATAKHESTNYTRSNEMWNGNAYDYFEGKYGPNSGHRDAIPMGNTEAGDGFKYRGRGYVQLTWKENYRKIGNELGIDLVNNPDRASEPWIAAQATVIGMRDGIFTGRKLSDYIGNGQVDFVGARRIVNGNDKAALIAGYAETYMRSRTGELLRVITDPNGRVVGATALPEGFLASSLRPVMRPEDLNNEPPRFYRRVVSSNIKLLFQRHSRFHRSSPLLHAA